MTYHYDYISALQTLNICNRCEWVAPWATFDNGNGAVCPVCGDRSMLHPTSREMTPRLMEGIRAEGGRLCDAVLEAEDRAGRGEYPLTEEELEGILKERYGVEARKRFRYYARSLGRSA